jgi:hypothetical protein
MFTLTDALIVGAGCLLAVLWAHCEVQAEERERKSESKKERARPTETPRPWEWACT